jgi:hypothetical protein
MSQLREMAELIQRCQHDKWGWLQDIDEILRLPHVKLCSYHSDALAYYKLQRHYNSLDEAGEHPQNTTVFIREVGRSLQYIRYGDKWEYVGDVPDSVFE